jgi:hypothetical protein
MKAIGPPEQRVADVMLAPEEVRISTTPRSTANNPLLRPGSIRRPFRFPAIRSRNRSIFYICHQVHDHDQVFGDNIAEYLMQAGLQSKTILLPEDGQRPQLKECLAGTARGVIGFNSQLDHSWIETTNFMDAAAASQVPVIQWILDHPSSRLAEYNNSTAANSRFLFSSAEAERYFKQYGIPHARTATVACVGPSRYSRLEDLSLQTFSGRSILCIVAINMRRLGGTIEDAWSRVEALEPPLASAIREAVEQAYHDMIRPIEFHLGRALEDRSLLISGAVRHHCMQALEEVVQIMRRRHILTVARDFPVLIQSDEASRPLRLGARATFEENVGMALTWSRLKRARAQVSISNMHDMVHDRILNGLNAGCLNIVEDNFANRHAFEDGRNALFFRYDDDSLRQCLDLVCNDLERAYAVAAEGFALRDNPPFRFGGFENILQLAQ